MMGQATRPTDERERREAAARAGELAREQAARSERQRQAVGQRIGEARQAAGREVRRELYELIKGEGLRCLSDPETPRLLGRAAEKTLGEHQTRLAELGHTGETLAEKMVEYVGRVRANPEAFLEKMEPGRAREREPERGRGPERDDDRGFGYSR